jgi:hypothetical protein
LKKNLIKHNFPPPKYNFDHYLIHPPPDED